jgi:superfamily II DNA/RNA helicase
MTNEFTQLGLQLQLVQAVTDLGYTTPTPIQSKIIPLMLAGHDVIGQAQTLAKAGKWRIRKSAVTLELA